VVESLKEAKERLATASQRCGISFMAIVEGARLSHSGVKGIQSGLYKLPPARLPDALPLAPENRRVLESSLTDLRLQFMLKPHGAASLVFAHAVLDDLATECCSIISIADPYAWRDSILNKQVKLADLERSSFEQTYSRLLGEHLKRIGFSESLAKRIDLIHSKCPPKPPQPSFPSVVDEASQEFSYDPSRIQALDRMRQDILHRAKLASPDTVLDDVAYLERTCYYVVWLVAHKYGMLVRKESSASGDPELFLPIDGWELPR
jgi:hypothetical protein